MNHVVLVGRIVEKELKDKDLYLTLIVYNDLKNDKGKYESNLIPCLLKEYIATATQQYCNIDDVVGVRGILENKENNLYVLVNRLSFLHQNGNNKQKNNG